MHQNLGSLSEPMTPKSLAAAGLAGRARPDRDVGGLVAAWNPLKPLNLSHPKTVCSSVCSLPHTAMKCDSDCSDLSREIPGKCQQSQCASSFVSVIANISRGTPAYVVGAAGWKSVTFICDCFPLDVLRSNERQKNKNNGRRHAWKWMANV